MQTQLRLLLETEAVWSGSSLFDTLTSLLWITALKTNILLENRKRSFGNFRTFTKFQEKSIPLWDWNVFRSTTNESYAANNIETVGTVCVKRPLSKRPNIVFQVQISLNAGQTYCRMLQEAEHSAIFLTFIKLPIVIKIFVLSTLSGYFTLTLKNLK